MKLIITNSTEIDIKENETVLSPIYGNNIFNIDEYAADSEFEEVEVKNLNQIPLGMLGNVLDNYIKKIRQNGEIIIHGVDLYLLGLKIVNRDLNLGEINQYLFGGPSVELMNASITGINDLVSHLEERGLSIISKGFDGIKFKVTARRK